MCTSADSETTPRCDREIVQAWDAWRALILIHGRPGYEEEPAATMLAALDDKIMKTPAHGVSGIAAKVGHMMAWALDWKRSRSRRFGFTTTDDDMDFDIKVCADLARDLEKLTGVVVAPTWEMQCDGEECGS